MVRGGSGEGGRRGKRRRGPLTQGQLTDLRQARKRHRTENRKRKMLKMDEEGVSVIRTPFFQDTILLPCVCVCVCVCRVL